MLMLLLILSTTFVTNSLAQIQLFEYPYLQPLTTFQTSKFLGTWYQISRTPNQYEIDQKCSIIGYALHDYSPLTAYIASTDIKTGELSRLPASDTARELYLAQWDFRYPANLEASNGVTSILDTDYVNWAVKTLVQPSQNRPGYELIVWILSREKTLSKIFYERALNVLRKNNIPIDSLALVDQNYCYIS
ncbi:hypothetical protein HCN44_006384 [Aphidius gifuensis]|uniref:Lipocalin/cytosolic fatty-acid binding domain-containing protein n=1 Tax=Aphidius gifuensis TaxID=684658 RepID=A0A834XY75_APHGI|nr:insecticyanin-A-like [Aphidius gifuensis]KAF7993324.1 hypothetical protein HCN44_006384 [Aphidius gifuensis]